MIPKWNRLVIWVWLPMPFIILSMELQLGLPILLPSPLDLPPLLPSSSTRSLRYPSFRSFPSIYIWSNLTHSIYPVYLWLIDKQEFGDFAILIQSGFSKKRALLFNFLSACACIIGSIIGVAIGEEGDASRWILALVAGGFIYIALADMVHELLREKGTKQTILQVYLLIIIWFLFFQRGRYRVY